MVSCQKSFSFSVAMEWIVLLPRSRSMVHSTVSQQRCTKRLQHKESAVDSLLSDLVFEKTSDANDQDGSVVVSRRGYLHPNDSGSPKWLQKEEASSKRLASLRLLGIPLFRRLIICVRHRVFTLIVQVIHFGRTSPSQKWNSTFSIIPMQPFRINVSYFCVEIDRTMSSALTVN